MLFNTIDEKTKHHTFNLIRGLAVLLVLFTHLDNFKILFIWPFSYQPFQGFIGRTGVYLFFLLSGYLIWASAQQTLTQSNGYLKYAVNRMTRIYPLYLVCIIFIVLFSEYFLGHKKPEVSAEVIFRHLFFLQRFDPYVSSKLNGPFWTLTHEFLFYLLVPILFFLKPSHWLLLSSIFITQLLFNFTQGLHEFINFWCLFAVGILIQMHKKIFTRFISIFLLLAIGILCIVYIKIKAFQLPFAILLFNCLLNFQFKSWIFKPLVGLGIISYSVYVWHYVLIHLISPYITKVHPLIPPIKPWLPNGLVAEALFLIIFIFVFSTLSYLLIEKPCMTTLRKKLLQKFEG